MTAVLPEPPKPKRPFSVGRLLTWLALGWVGLWVVAGLVLFIALLAADPMPDKAVLRVELDGELPEQRPPPLAALFDEDPPLVLRDVTRSIRAAADDPRIVGLVLDIKEPELSLAQIDEIAEAMEVFEKSGKWQRGFLETAGELSPGNRHYLLAALTGHVTLAPPGEIGLAGLRAEVPFIRGTLDKLHVTPSFDQRYAYKTAANMFTEKGFTKAHAESVKVLVDDLQDQFVAMVAARRKQDPKAVRAWLEDGPYGSEEAKQRGIIDEVAYWDQLLGEARTLAELEEDDEDEPFVSVAVYSQNIPPKPTAGRLALVVGEGAIVRGEGRSGFDGEAVMGSDKVAQALRDARQDEVKGVLLRVDSPGGSYVASDLVRREVELTRKQGIPVVVSMGSLAASGGYFISMDADAIFATPGTLTGSIGVYGGSFALRGFFQDWLGITFEVYDALPEGSAISSLDGPDARELEKRKLTLDRIYEDFVGKAAIARKKTRDELHAVAQGRVWTGRQAKDVGLVDELGGFHAALRKLKVLAGLDADATIELAEYPQPEGLLASLGHLIAAQKLPDGLDKSLQLVQEVTRASGGALAAMPYRIDIR